jgi:hypothetical protein
MPRRICFQKRGAAKHNSYKRYTEKIEEQTLLEQKKSL